MIYQSVSIENVISKVIRETKVSDSSAIMELYEVIPDAIGMMQTRFQLTATYKDLVIKFHKAKLPVGMVVMPAVEYCGHRLHWTNTSRTGNAPLMDFGRGSYITGNPNYPDTNTHGPTDDSVFQTKFVPTANPATGNQMDFLSYTLQELGRLPEHPQARYWVEMGYINTTFPSGVVRVHYKVPPLDENGNLLIPDNSFYREAIYYWCRAKLIGMGAFDDKVIGEEKCMQRFELNAGRAIDDIDYPTEDQMQQIVANQVHLSPTRNYWESFGGRAERMTYGS